MLPTNPYLLQRQPQDGTLVEGTRETDRDSGNSAAPSEETSEQRQGATKKRAPLFLRQPFHYLFLDSVLFEVGVLGRQLLPLVRHARSLCTEAPLVFPAG